MSADFLLSALALRLGLASGLYRQTDLGVEKRCSGCGDYWPYDREFFRPLDRGRGSGSCIACIDGARADARRARGAKQLTVRGTKERAA